MADNENAENEDGTIIGSAQETEDGKNTEANAEGAGDSEGSDSGEKEGGKDGTGGAPEAYEAFTFPEGTDAAEELQASFASAAKELNLDQATAQKLVDLSMASSKETAEAQAKAANEQVEKWGEESRNDKEFGGAKFEENMTFVASAVDQFGSKEFRALMDSTGLGNHPEFVRFIYRVGRAMSEDKVETGGESEGQQKSRGERLYGGREAA